MYDKWHTYWQGVNECRLTKNFMPRPSKNKTNKILKHSRSQVRRLIEVITGQNNLNYIQSKVYPGTSELCRFCEEEDETFEHLINECPCFTTFRFQYLNNKPIINSLDWDNETLLKFSHLAQINEALEDYHNINAQW